LVQDEIVIDVVDLRLIVPRQNRSNCVRVVRRLRNHRFYGLVVRMFLDEGDHMIVVAPEDQWKGLNDNGR